MTDPEAIDVAAARAASRARIELEQTEAAFNELRDAAMKALVATGPDEAAKRERLIVTLQILPAVQEALLMVVANGTAAQHALAQTGITRRWA